MGGYELVKSPAGKRTAVAQRADVDERPMDKEKETTKRDPILVIAVIVMVLVGVAVILGVVIAFFAVNVK